MGKLTEGEVILENSINYYFDNMNKLHTEGFEDETGHDIDNWYAICQLISKDDINKEELFEHFRDEERVDFIVSFSNVVKHLKGKINLNL